MKKNYNFSKGKRGAVLPVPAGKTRITIRIDDDVLDWFRKLVHAAGGGSYQTLMNSALREHMESETEPLEDTFRRVLREVLPDSQERKSARKRTARRKIVKEKPVRKKVSRKKAAKKKAT
jgi:hypothetical protein